MSLGGPGETHRHGRTRRLVDQGRSERVRRPTGEVDEEFDRAVRRGLGDERVDATLEAPRGLARELVAARGARDRDLVEAGGLDEDVGGPRGDLGAGTAHHARQPDGARVVRDDEVLGVERPLDVVEGGQALAGRGATDRQPALHRREVVPVQRLAQFEHDVVRDVHGQ